MKFREFVPEKDLQISNDEIDMWKHFIKDSFGKDGITIECKNTMYVKHNKSYAYKANHVDFTFIVDGIPSESRDSNKNRILGLSEIVFMLYKNSGYFDVTDYTKCQIEYKRNYDDAPEFQWSLRILTNGKMIPYKCRKKIKIYFANYCQYGTELSDFDFFEIAKYLKYLIKK